MNLQWRASHAIGKDWDYLASPAGFLALLARAVGSGVGMNLLSIVIPCHRVLNTAAPYKHLTPLENTAAVKPLSASCLGWNFQTKTGTSGKVFRRHFIAPATNINLQWRASHAIGKYWDYLASPAGFLALLARAVGSGVGMNLLSIVIPCHRVLNTTAPYKHLTPLENTAAVKLLSASCLG